MKEHGHLELGHLELGDSALANLTDIFKVEKVVIVIKNAPVSGKTLKKKKEVGNFDHSATKDFARCSPLLLATPLKEDDIYGS